MRILLTNDDGIMAEGIYTLAKELEKNHELIIVAPDNQRSAQSHAITLFQPLKVKDVKLEGLKSKAYSVSGTPADCVRVGLEVLSEEPIDLVFSGINVGLNSGMDILYSGTVSAAIEANIYNIPSIAVSTDFLDGKANFNIAAKYGIKVFETLKDQLLDTNMVLNINTPYTEGEELSGLKVCRIGEPIYDYYFANESGQGERTLEVKGRKEIKLAEGTDRYYLSQGYATLTPLHYDLTNFNSMEKVKKWIEIE